MIAKVSRGWRVGGLVRYLLGPGRFNEHTDPHVIGVWDGEPERHQAVEELAAHMADLALGAGIPQRAPEPGPDGQVPQGMVWHCSLRNSPDDPVLTDAQWAEVVEDLMDRTGIAPVEGIEKCRWVAVRHAPDHVHVAALLIRQDIGRRMYPRRDYVVARQVCRDAEQRYGLTPTGEADRTAAAAVTRAELESAQRRKAVGPSREWLQDRVRAAAAQARDVDEFLGILGDERVQTRVRRDSTSGEPVGYSVAMTGDVNADWRPVFYSGSKLAPDLSLGRLRQRWAQVPDPVPVVPRQAGERSAVGRAERAAACGDALSAIEHASAVLASGDGEDGAEGADAIAHAAGEMTEAVGRVLADGDAGRQVFADWVGTPMDRATRTPYRVVPGSHREAGELRRAARRLAAVRLIIGRGHKAGPGDQGIQDK